MCGIIGYIRYKLHMKKMYKFVEKNAHLFADPSRRTFGISLLPRCYSFCTNFSYAEFYSKKEIADEYNFEEKRLYFADKTAQL